MLPEPNPIVLGHTITGGRRSFKTKPNGLIRVTESAAIIQYLKIRLSDRALANHRMTIALASFLNTNALALRNVTLEVPMRQSPVATR